MEAKPSPVESSLSEVSHVLWRQRVLIETLLYRLEVQHLLLIDGQDRWVASAAAEVEAAIADIREQELVRTAVVSRAAELLKLPPDTSLTALREAAPEPWPEILGDHQAAFLAMVAEAEETTRRNRELLNRGLGESRRLFDSLAGSNAPNEYSKEGRSLKKQNYAPTLVDREA